jgi:AAA domain/Transcriptional regulator, AbiEi antitoxin
MKQAFGAADPDDSFAAACRKADAARGRPAAQKGTQSMNRSEAKDLKDRKTADGARRRQNAHGPQTAASPTSAEALQNMTFPPIKYVVPGIIVEGLTLIAGKPKIGKSWLLLHTAIAVARGGFTLGDIHCIECDVLYCALEDNLRRLQSRMTKLLGISQPWPKRLQFRCEMPRLTEGGLDSIKQWIESVEHPRLIIIDVLTRVRPPRKKDQPQYDADYDSVVELRTLANAHGIAVVVVHHQRKMEADDPFDTISGTLGLTGVPDSVLVLKYDRDGSGTVVLHGRGRDLAEIEKAISFNKSTCVWTITGEVPDVRASTERTAILAAMQEIGGPASANEVAAGAELKPGSVRKMLERMAKAGTIARIGRGKYQLPSAEEGGAGHAHQ